MLCLKQLQQASDVLVLFEQDSSDVAIALHVCNFDVLVVFCLLACTRLAVSVCTVYVLNLIAPGTHFVEPWLHLSASSMSAVTNARGPSSNGLVIIKFKAACARKY